MSGHSRRLLLDTNAVIYLLGGKPQLVRLAAGADWLGISIITRIEFLAFPNLGSADIALFERLLARIEVIGLSHDDQPLLQQIIDLRQRYRLKLPDAVITASAIKAQATLVTADRKLLQLAGKVTGLNIQNC